MSSVVAPTDTDARGALPPDFLPVLAEVSQRLAAERQVGLVD